MGTFTQDFAAQGGVTARRGYEVLEVQVGISPPLPSQRVEAIRSCVVQ